MEKQNQHYVPQYYFRKFSNGTNHIRMILKRNGKFIENAKIAKQASKNNFYGDTNIERKITEYDTKYSKTLSNIIEEMNIGNISKENIINIIKAICFQEKRTLTYRILQEPLMKFNKDFFKPQIDDLENYDSGVSEEATEAIKKVMKEVFNKLSDTTYFQLYEMFNIEQEFFEICDLEMTFIKNITDFPFIFSDNPIVRFNLALQDFDCSKTGNKNYGLIIYYPLNSKNAVLMFDSEAYNLKPDSLIINLNNKTDIEYFNKLQIYNAENSIYFQNSKDKEYVYNLWKSEKDNDNGHTSKIELLEELTLNGYKTGNKVHVLTKDEFVFFPKFTFLKIKDFFNNQPLPYCFYRSRFITINEKYRNFNFGKVNITKADTIHNKSLDDE